MRLIIKCDHLKWCWKPQRFTKWEKLWREFPRYRCAWGAVCCGFLWMAVVWNSCRCGPRTARRAGPLLLFNIDRWCRLKWDYSCSPASRLNAHLISRKARVCVFVRGCVNMLEAVRQPFALANSRISQWGSCWGTVLLHADVNVCRGNLVENRPISQCSTETMSCRNC